ncbi:unnamed protein product [Leptidea sinapis]|uniref:Uncharacterized protein n=1 Tax=Leptidea sinapis TaxID=189913 RepID=A0A5E4Q0P5_9NEOP|nr:unnamed protein product [Leptidea sinapis]
MKQDGQVECVKCIVIRSESKVSIVIVEFATAAMTISRCLVLLSFSTIERGRYSQYVCDGIPYSNVNLAIDGFKYGFLNPRQRLNAFKCGASIFNVKSNFVMREDKN